MSKIKIELSEEQYKELLKLVYLGEWVSQSYKEEPSKIVEEVEQVIYEASKGSESENLLELDKKADMYYPTQVMDEEMLDNINDYDDYVFWDELVERLAERDLINKVGEKQVEKMSFEDKEDEQFPFIEKYEDEFSENGIDKLKLEQK